MNHLSMTIAAEEPDITSIAIRPGVIGWSLLFRTRVNILLIQVADTQMQREIRERHAHAMGDHHEKFVKLKENGKLLKPEQPGHVIARLALEGGKPLSGQFLEYVSHSSSNDSGTD